MGRVIKLFIYYLLYTFAFTGIFSGGYMIANHTLEFPQSDATVFQLTMWAQVLSTLAVGVHLLVWKYVKRDQLSLSFPNAGKVMLASIILIVGMGCWTNYLTELTGLPDTMEEIFTKAMYNPLGVISIVVMAPIVEELLFRGILFGSFASSFSYKIAMVLSAAIFTLGHYSISWPSVFIIGVLLAWIYWRTDNLAVTMVIHCTINLGTFLSKPILALLSVNQTLGIMAALLMVLLGIGITYLSTKIFLKKHDTSLA